MGGMYDAGELESGISRRWKDMCEGRSGEVMRWVVDVKSYGEQMWERLGPAPVEQAEIAELARFKRLCVHAYFTSEVARQGALGRIANVKGAMVSKGSEALRFGVILLLKSAATKRRSASSSRAPQA